MNSREDQSRLVDAVRGVYGAQPAPDPAVRASAWAAIERRSRRRAPRRTRSRRLRLAGAAVATAALAAAAIALLPQSEGPPPQTASPAARAVFARVAIAAADERPLRDGEYRYLSTRQRFLLPGGQYDKHSFERWMGRDGSGRTSEEGKPDVVYPPDSGRRDAPYQEWAGFAGRQLQALPTDAGGLRRELDERATGEDLEPGGLDLSSSAVTIVNSPAPPAVRAAAFRVLATLPGVRVRGRVRIAGRRGVELAIPRGGMVDTIVIAPTRGLLLAERSFVRDPARADRGYRDLSPGTLVSETIYTSAIVGSDAARPPRPADAA